MIRSVMSQRRGSAAAMTVALLALIFAIVAFLLALCRDPLQPGFALHNPFGEPLAGYDVESASGTVKAEIQIQLNRDLRAALELQRRGDNKELREKLDTLKFEKEVDFTKEPEKDGKKSRFAGEFRILFVSFKADGEARKEVWAMQKVPESGLWRRRFGFGPSDVVMQNKDLAKEMREWEGH